jgi:hypothetical protein
MLKYHIQTVELTSAQASISFNSIPQDFTDLYFLFSTRENATGYTGSYIVGSFNSTTSGYNIRILEGNGSSAASASFTSGTDARIMGVSLGSAPTANTFGSCSLHIPNYTSSSNKSYSSDSVMENNATSSTQELLNGLWSNTSPITSATFTAYFGNNWAAGTTISLYGVRRGSDGATLVSPVIEGGIVTTSGGYTYHKFTSSSSIKVNRNISVEALLVAGGGSSGNGYSGGGGAGGVLQSSVDLIAQQYEVIVGAGGISSNGSNSSFSSLQAIGGGRGADGGRNNGFDGGSGGGGGGVTSSPNTMGGLGVSGQGNNGGQGTVGISSYEVSGGGGGAGAVGGNATTSTSGNGGAGTGAYSTWASATSSGASGYYAGGGAGGHWYRASGTAGIGGGGEVGNAGTANTGGGGGGRYLGGAGFAGGSGVVIIRYLTP